MEKDALLLVTGFIVGGVHAIAGGGMLIGFPLLIALGIPPIVANATGAVVTIPGQITAAFGYRQYLKSTPALYPTTYPLCARRYCRRRNAAPYST